MIDQEQLKSLIKQAVREVLDERGYALHDELMDKDQVAKFLGVTTRTVTTWMAREGLPHQKGHGGRVTFQREDVLRWAREHAVPIKLKAVG